MAEHAPSFATGREAASFTEAEWKAVNRWISEEDGAITEFRKSIFWAVKRIPDAK